MRKPPRRLFRRSPATVDQAVAEEARAHNEGENQHP
jgi:hypothetical protein